MDGILKYYNNAKFHKFDNYCGYMNNIPIPRKYTLKHLGIKEHIVYKWQRGKKCTFIYIYIYLYTGGGHGNPLQYSCLENPMDSKPMAVSFQCMTKFTTN